VEARGNEHLGATSVTYTTVSADAANAITCAVTATNATGSTTATSNSVTPSAVDTTPPAAPTGLTATSSAGAIILNWNDNTEPDLNATAPYIVERATAVGGPFTQIATTVASDYIDHAVTAGVTYYYRVRAEDNAP
jgi:fibronectin type 3 domain-containing protein